MPKELTIIIPTYNRKERLLRQLDSIACQGLVEHYHLMILDNCSDYSIEEAIEEHNFSEDFSNNITIIHRPINTRMGYNLAGVFLFPKTKWMFIASDDDISTKDCVSTLLDSIKAHPNASYIKYQFTYNRNYDDITIHSVPELESLYKQKYFTPGDLFYIGNNLINLEAIKEYLGSAFEDCSHLIPHVMPMLHQLVDGKAEVVFSQSHVQTYVNNVSGDTWMAIPTILRFAQLFDIRWSNPVLTQRVFRIVCDHFSTFEVAKMLLQEKELVYRNYAFSRLMKTVFRRHLSLKERCYWLAYRVENFTRLRIIPAEH